MFTLVNHLSRRIALRGTPRAVRAALRLFLVLFALGGVSACGDATGLSRVDGTYYLETVEGVLLPATSGQYTVQSGTLRLDNGDWEMVLRFSQGDVTDFGTYRRSGSTIEFDYDRYPGFFDGTLYSSRTLYVDYDLGGTLGIVRLEYRR